MLKRVKFLVFVASVLGGKAINRKHKRMKTLVTILLVFTALAGSTQPSDTALLRQLKTVDWPTAYREGDTTLLARLLADEFQSIDAAGEVSTKRAELEYIKSNRPTYSSFVYTINRLDVFENGTAIVSGTGVMKGTGKDGPYTVSYQSSNVFIKRGGRWQAVASHVSGVKRT